MRILVTAGPTREYLDDVRFLSNASSGRMGHALARAALERGHRVTLVSGPVSLAPPAGSAVVPVVSAQQMFAACLAEFPACDGVIAAAAVCDYRPVPRWAGKLQKADRRVTFEFEPTPDILAELGRHKAHQWLVGFALEAAGGLAHARDKLRRKNLDAIVLNDPGAFEVESSRWELLDRSGAVVLRDDGLKTTAASLILGWIETHLAR